MSAPKMRELRLKIGYTQAEMAKLLGFSYRGYQELEGERASFALRHLSVLERISLRLAVERDDPSLALASIVHDAELLVHGATNHPDKSHGASRR